MARKKAENFETLIRDTEKLVEELESGELSLDDALLRYTKGVENLRAAGKLLEQAEQKVKTLLSDIDGGDFNDLEDFDEQASEGEEA